MKHFSSPTLARVILISWLWFYLILGFAPSQTTVVLVCEIIHLVTWHFTRWQRSVRIILQKFLPGVTSEEEVLKFMHNSDKETCGGFVAVRNKIVVKKSNYQRKISHVFEAVQYCLEVDASHQNSQKCTSRFFKPLWKISKCFLGYGNSDDCILWLTVLDYVL